MNTHDLVGLELFNEPGLKARLRLAPTLFARIITARTKLFFPHLHGQWSKVRGFKITIHINLVVVRSSSSCVAKSPIRVHERCDNDMAVFADFRMRAQPFDEP